MNEQLVDGEMPKRKRIEPTEEQLVDGEMPKRKRIEPTEEQLVDGEMPKRKMTEERRPKRKNPKPKRPEKRIKKPKLSEPIPFEVTGIRPKRKALLPNRPNKDKKSLNIRVSNKVMDVLTELERVSGLTRTFWVTMFILEGYNKYYQSLSGLEVRGRR